MTIKVYISGICGSHEVRKHQQRVLFILQSLPIDLQIVDITEPGREEDLTFMQEEAKKHDKKTQLPPQIFNNSEYCGDYADFELANDDDQMMRFLKLETGEIKEPITQNGVNDHINNQDGSETLSEPILNNVEENISNDQQIVVNNTDDVTEEEGALQSSESKIDDIKTEENEPVEEKEEVSEEEESE